MRIYGQVFRYFGICEIESNDGSSYEFESFEEFIAFVNHGMMMDEFREWYGRVIDPTSWFRSEFWNEHEGGAEDSKHLKGIATDFEYPWVEWVHFTEVRKLEFINNVVDKWHELCIKYEVGGRCYWYDWGFHLDSREGEFNSGYLTQN